MTAVLIWIITVVRLLFILGALAGALLFAFLVREVIIEIRTDKRRNCGRTKR